MSGFGYGDKFQFQKAESQSEVTNASSKNDERYVANWARRSGKVGI
jgi:hypothetical protein